MVAYAPGSLLKADAQLLGVSAGQRHTRWNYDARSRVTTSVFGTTTPDPNPRPGASGSATEQFSVADFRAGQTRTSTLDKTTSDALAARGIDTSRIDPPSLTVTEAGGGHKIAGVTKGTKSFTFNYEKGSEVVDDGRFVYAYDMKGRIISATEKATAPPFRRVVYVYSGPGRLVGRRAEYAQSAGEWKLEDRKNILDADGLPAETTFAWDPVSDWLLTVAKAGATPNDPQGALFNHRATRQRLVTGLPDPPAPDLGKSIVASGGVGTRMSSRAGWQSTPASGESKDEWLEETDDSGAGATPTVNRVGDRERL